MFLVPKKVNDLDYILNAFEVAYRCNFAETLLAVYPNENSMLKKLRELSLTYSKPADGIVPAQFLKYSAKIKKYESIKAINDLYGMLNTCTLSVADKDFNIQGNVPYVSEVIDFMLLFYQPLFESLGTAFGRIEDYEEHLRNYLVLRNSASHPASSKISVVDAQEVIRFIIISMGLMEDKYFWYVTKNEITECCNSLLGSFDDKEPLTHNLTNITKKHKNLIERNKEIQRIKELLLGEGKIRRTTGSIVLHGSGGVGKTALALEVCYDIVLRSLEKSNEFDYNFILWLSSKEEELVYDPIIGNLNINKLMPQFSTLNDLLNSLSGLLAISVSSAEKMISELDQYSGIIVLDNYETISTDEKKKINEFINMCPRNIQFIITSRIIEDIAENSIPLVGFGEEDGKIFIQKYCEDNLYQPCFDNSLQVDFIKETCGNPLIMVLSLGRIIEGLVTMQDIVGYLRNYATTEVETLADFMYKSMLEEVIIALSEEKKCDVGNILNVIFIYGEPIDLYSLRDLTGVETKVLEDVVSILGNKLILSKQKGYYKLNELAIKFVLIKTLPTSIVLKALIAKIEDYKNKISKDLQRLASDKAMFPVLKSIVNDWKPISDPEQIAMAQAYSVYARIKVKLDNSPQTQLIINMVGEINQEFQNIKQRSNHPYIKFQHARVLKLLLRFRRVLISYKLFDGILAQMQEAYSEAYTEIWTRYRHIMTTKSFSAFLLQYGNFLMDNNEYEEAFKLLDRLVQFCENYCNSDEDILVRFNAYYYYSQAALNCARLDDIYSEEYYSACETNVVRALPMVNKCLEKLYGAKRIEFCRKKNVLELLKLFCNSRKCVNTEKKTFRVGYERLRNIKVPHTLKWVHNELCNLS